MKDPKREATIRRMLEEDRKEEKRKDLDWWFFGFCLGFMVLGGITSNIMIYPLFYFASVFCFLCYIEFLIIPKSFEEDMNLGWHFQGPQRVFDNAIEKGKYWQTLILIIIFFTTKFLK